VCFCLLAYPFYLTSTQTHTKGNNKNNEGKQHRKNTNGNVQSVTTWKKAEKRSEAESFKHMKSKYPTHLKMAM
jgi:hypothetical protein